jgi:type IV secretory pathway TrbD component
MRDITSPRVLYLKGALFVVTGVLASAAILVDHPSWKVAGFLGLAIWAFARAYYFAFYVIEHYVDPAQRYAGLGAFLRYLIRRRAESRGAPPDSARERAG